MGLKTESKFATTRLQLQEMIKNNKKKKKQKKKKASAETTGASLVRYWHAGPSCSKRRKLNELVNGFQ